MARCRNLVLPLLALASVVAGCASGSDGPTYSVRGDLGFAFAPGGGAPAAATVAGPTAMAAGTAAKTRADGIARAMSRSCRSKLTGADATAVGRIADHRRGGQELAGR